MLRSEPGDRPVIRQLADTIGTVALCTLFAAVTVLALLA
jgi:hypothetical protein